MKKGTWSLRGFVTAVIIFLLLLYEVQTLLGSTLISRTMKIQQRNSYSSMLEIYCNNLSDDLEQMDRFLLSSVLMEGNAREVIESTTDLNQYLAEVKMQRSFSQSISQMERLSGILWYAKNPEILVQVMKNNPENISKKQLDDYADQVIAEVKNKNRVDWFFYEMEGKPVIVRVLENQNTYVIGWMDADSLFSGMEETLNEESALIFLKAGREMQRKGTGGRIFIPQKEEQEEVTIDHVKYQMIYPENEHTITMCLAMPESQLYHYLTNPYIMLPLLVLGTGILVLFISVILRKYFIGPMHSLQDAMLKMQGGDFDVRVQSSTFFYEFGLLNANFDKMAEKIKDLKIEVYEKQLEKQEAELQYLQQQIKPHFLTNCLNTIRNLLMMKRYEQAEIFTTLLGKNIRYDLSKNTVVSLKEEIDHVKSYIALQQIRYENQLTCFLEAGENLLFYEVPSMILQTFVENAVKHQISPDEVLTIWVSVSFAYGRLHIIIEDSGDGFSAGVLEKLRKGEPIFRNGMEHTGIANVKRRLQIMYQNRASISFENGEKGARVNILLPAREPYEI